MYLVSSCLIGINCRYDGANCYNEKIKKMYDEGKLLPVCPEELGGLSTPRVPSEIIDSKVISKDGKDVTTEFLSGANKVLEIVKKNKIKKAILKSKSPSCGYKLIYDGSFSGNLVNGNGLTAQILIDNGIELYSERDFS